MIPRNYKRGFIALFSVIIISSILLLLASSLSFSGFFGRMNIYDTELKKESDALASACIESVLLELAKDVSYETSTDEDVDVGDEVCTILSVVNSGTSAIIQTEGISGKAYTYYEAMVDTDDLKIISFKELSDEP